MSVKIVIECEDYCAAHSLNDLATKVKNTNILKPVYNNGKAAKSKGDHYTAKITYIEEK